MRNAFVTRTAGGISVTLAVSAATVALLAAQPLAGKLSRSPSPQPTPSPSASPSALSASSPTPTTTTIVCAGPDGLLRWVPAVAAIFTLLAALGALWNANNSSKAVEASQRAASANLLLSVVKDYAATDFGKAMARLRQWKDGIGAQFAREYADRVRRNDPTAEDLPPKRRQVSSFFNAVRSLSEQGVLERSLVARTLGEPAFKFFVEVVDPLDRAHVEQVMQERYDPMTRDFCQRLLDDLFPPVAP